MWYKPESMNELRHPSMPPEYPWIISDQPFDGAIEITQEDLDALLAIDISAYQSETQYVNISDVTPRQFRSALVLLGISIAAVEEAMNQLPEPQKSLAWIEWEYSLAFKRNNPLVAMVGDIMGKTPSELDSIWAFAGTL